MLANIKQIFSTVAQLICAAGLIASTASMATAAEYNDTIRVTIDFAKIVKLDRPASTVIVGNTGVVEAAIEDDKTMILTGQAPGSTNIIVMDVDGEEVQNVRVVVATDTRELTTVYQGTKRQSYSCQPRCEQVAIIGDDSGEFAKALSQIFGRQRAENND